MQVSRYIKGRAFSRVSFPPLYNISFHNCQFIECIFDRLDNCQMVKCEIVKSHFEVVYDSVIANCEIGHCNEIALGGKSHVIGNRITGLAFSGVAFPKARIDVPAMDWVHAQLAMALGTIERLEVSGPGDLVIENNYQQRPGDPPQAAWRPVGPTTP